MMVRSRAPLRLGLAGGGTDISPYCDKFGGNVLNVTIDKYAYTQIELMNSSFISIEASDLNIKINCPLSSKLELDGQLDLHKAVYNEIIESYNDGKAISVKINTFCEAPPGSGLGSSSTLVVSIIKAFVELLNIPLDDYKIAQLAFNIERINCGLEGGRQDGYRIKNS